MYIFVCLNVFLNEGLCVEIKRLKSEICWHDKPMKAEREEEIPL
jgi:hypothetical protein